MIWFIFSSVDPEALIERIIYGLRGYGFQTVWNISQSNKTHATHSYASDWHTCKNKQDCFYFWAIIYFLNFFLILIRTQMHFVLLNTISLLFVQEGHFQIILKKGLLHESANDAKASDVLFPKPNPQTPNPQTSICMFTFSLRHYLVPVFPVGAFG